MNVGQYPSVSSLDFMFHELVTDVMFVSGVMSTSNDGFSHPVIPYYLPGIDTGYRIVLQKVTSEANPKVCNHGEGPY